MVRRYLAAAALAVAPLALGAEELPFVEAEAIAQCLASDPAPTGCIGVASERCIEAAGGAGAVLGACFAQELAFWDDLLNSAYRDALAAAQAFDETAESMGNVPAIAEEQLRAMQRSWIPYRDARCALTGLSYRGGTGAGPGGTECEMRLTAEQALVLQALEAELQPNR